MGELLTRSAPADLPVGASFAVLDLAAHPSLLRWVYESLEVRRPGSWVPLFLETCFHERWNVGPALVDLQAAPDSVKNLAKAHGDGIPGVLLDNDGKSLSETARWLRTFLFAYQESEASLIRFYDPRIFGPFLAVLDERQHTQFIPAGVSWYWQDCHQWRCAAPPDTAGSVTQPAPSEWNFQLAQLNDLAKVRRKALVGQLSEQYGQWIPGNGSDQYVDDALTLAERLGLDKKADIERVLRACIRNRSEPTEARYLALAERADLSVARKLEQIEHRNS